MKSFFTDSLQDVLNTLNTNKESGLSEAQAKKKLEENGYNTLKEEKKKTWLQRFLAQFNDMLIIILLIAAAISFAVAIMENHGYAEPILIIMIVMLNALMGVIQESKAEKALEALKKMSAPQVKVVRDGTTQIVDSKELVVGDIIVLDAGDVVPADARLINSASLKVDESSLTGESV